MHRIVAPQLIAFSNGVSDSYNHPEGVAPADTRIGSGAAIETNGELRLVVTPA